MKTMHPVVLHGCTTWDQERLPIDEFRERLYAVQQIMKDNQVEGLIVYGDCREYSKLCYLTNYIPKHSWAILLVPASGNPCLVAKVAGTRDIPSVQVLTWIEEIRSAKQITDEVSQFIKKIMDSENDRSLEPIIGIYGAEKMRSRLYTEIAVGCQPYTLKNMDTALDRLLLRKRPKELAVIREASNILKSAVGAMQEFYQKGSSVVASISEADRIARNLGAQDVRLLYSLDYGHSLQPFETLSEQRNDPMMAYVAVEYLGYWAEAMVTLTQKGGAIYDRAVQLLDFFTVSMKPGAKMEDLVHSAMEIIKPYQLHPVTQGCFGHSIGLSLEENPFLHPSNGEAKIEDGSVFSIHAYLTDNQQENVLLSTILIINKSGNEIIWSSESL